MRLRSKKSTSSKSTISGESDTDDVDMLQRLRRSPSKTRPAPIPLENRCHQITLKGDRCGNRVWSLTPSASVVYGEKDSAKEVGFSGETSKCEFPIGTCNS